MLPSGAVLADRAWRVYADIRTRVERRGTNRTALASVGAPDRRARSAWDRELAERHDSYREAHPPASASVAVVCVSRRPHLLHEIVANVARQVDVQVEFVLVTNDDGYGAVDVEAALDALPTARAVTTPSPMSLGAALNLGLAQTGERFVAKFDDDDHYGAHHLVDSLRAHAYAGAGIVGKHSYYADVCERGERYLRFPGHEFRYSSTLAGGTLVFDRERVGDLAFPDISLGEDRAVIARCHRRGVATFSADRFNYVQWRGSDNTWNASAEEFLRGAERVDPEDEAHVVDR